VTAGVERATPPAPRWALPARIDPGEVRRIERLTRLPEPLCTLLVRRGIGTDADVRSYLRPSLEALHPPGLLPDMDAAASRIETALRSGETILVHGDYDVDGMTGAAVLSGGLADLGADVTPFVPHRTRDGYDLGPTGVATAADRGATLIVTVDCGVTAVDAVRLAGEQGIDVVVTDHHRPGPELPAAVAVVNPNRPNSRYPFNGLSGVGVGFKLIQELFERQGLGSGKLNRYLDLVALGTIADQVPLEDENRVFGRFGLQVLERTPRPGLRALMNVANVGRWSAPRASDVAFRLAPRLNSAGRIAEAADGLRALTTADTAEAEQLALQIEQTNVERRAADRSIYEEAVAMLEEDFDAERDRIVVLWSENWHPGVLGIAASRLVDRLGRPTILASVDGDRARGSARSIPSFHLYDALAACADLFDRFGGHAVAAGFDIPSADLPELRRRLAAGAVGSLPAESLGPEIDIDLEVALGDISDDFVRGFAYLEPFGSSNPIPRLLARDVTLTELGTVGGGEHLKAVLQQEGARLEAIAFREGRQEAELAAEPRRDVVFELHVEMARRGPRVQAHILSMAPCV